MRSGKCLGFITVFQMFIFIKGNPGFHSDMPDLRDVMRKEDFQNQLNELGTFEHRNPVANQNDIMQNRNAVIQSQNPSLHTFSKEYPTQQATAPQVPMHLPPIRPYPGSNKLEIEESELRRSEKTNEAFENLLQFMTIVNKVDEYLTEKTQSAIRAIAKIAEEASNNQYKRY